VEIESIPQAARQRIDRIASADLMVGVLADHGGSDLSVSLVRQAIEKLPALPRTVVIHGHGSLNGADAANAALSRIGK